MPGKILAEETEGCRNIFSDKPIIFQNMQRACGTISPRKGCKIHVRVLRGYAAGCGKGNRVA